MSNHIQVNQTINIPQNCYCDNCIIPFEIWLNIGECLIKNNIDEDIIYMNNNIQNNNIIKNKNIDETLNVKKFNNLKPYIQELQDRIKI